MRLPYWIGEGQGRMTMVTLREAQRCDFCGKAMRKGNHGYRGKLADGSTTHWHGRCAYGYWIDPSIHDIKEGH